MACARKAHTLRMTEGMRRALARLRQPPWLPWSPSGRSWGSRIPGTRSRSWPSEAARDRRAAAAWSKRYDPLLRHGVEGADGLGSLGYQTGTSEPPPDEQDGDSLGCCANDHHSYSVCHDVSAKAAVAHTLCSAGRPGGRADYPRPHAKNKVPGLGSALRPSLLVTARARLAFFRSSGKTFICFAYILNMPIIYMILRYCTVCFLPACSHGGC